MSEHSYSENNYHEAIAELSRKFGKLLLTSSNWRGIFGDWIDSYKETCEDISPQQSQKNRVNNSSRSEPSDVQCQLCSQNNNPGRCPAHLKKPHDRQGCVKRSKFRPGCLRAHEKGLLPIRNKVPCGQMQSLPSLYTPYARCKAATTKCTTKEELESNLATMSETTRTKTSQTMDVSLKMNTKGNRQVRTATIRMESRTVKVDRTAAFHTWA